MSTKKKEQKPRNEATGLLSVGIKRVMLTMMILLDKKKRFGASSMHQRDSRSALFAGYTGEPATTTTRRPTNSSGGYGLPQRQGLERQQGFRPATPNGRGQYSDAVLNELESQNDTQVEGILGKVRTLKDMTLAIGDEIRESSALADKMNDSFDSARLRLRGTMNRMLIMAQRTGVGWKVWLAFFAAVGLLFFYVWLS
ncbi:hypothetical protein CP533_4023 [Ophiocordyceps camponoti-saundersi (nom. inval.)]|nr:hypothetical protein CP533_4023 [Ophiocordyceps camponoti-saundersi (nom. inval.)]